ncbi:glycosyl hydrolase family 88 [Bacillus sp. FJAT-25509]|uniref:glycoside hydrolase family 88/105 protein n=1 Tax=Bacillus sp. FJAT-25509 TaxID=1712029 RepID=UPI0006FFEC10|nr:glycoside hydrolase family 105 protein [Bacillus sp. FJAT-25509]KQL41786.1 glycosyl hydrolase family 88 [Bacillus sp. FJAT-25509]
MNYSETKTINVTAEIALSMAEKASRTVMKTFSPKELPPANVWHYHQGVFLYGMQRVWEITQNQEYFEYLKSYIDNLLDSEGNFLFERDQLDSIQVGILLFPLMKATKDQRYRKAADKLRHLYDTLNKTKEGGFWHKDKYPYQMWLDGLFMAGPFALMYQNATNEQGLDDMVLYQEKLMRVNMKDENSGLFYHAYDESKRMPWANPETGCSPEFWGRSVGWYGTALIDILDLLSKNHSGRVELIESLQSLIKSIVSFQDEKTGLWYQIVDKGNQEDNWLESSCSSLFVYTIARAVEQGYVGKEYIETAIKGYKGLLNEMIEVDGDSLTMKGICIGTSAGVYDYYVSRPVSENDLHGVGAFILASVALVKMIKK